LSTGRAAEAVFQLREAIRINQVKHSIDAVGVYNDLGLALMRLQRYREAAEAFQQLIISCPTYPGAAANLHAAWSRAMQPAVRPG
jgi:Flp pilus assembly protein TadD